MDDSGSRGDPGIDAQAGRAVAGSHVDAITAGAFFDLEAGPVMLARKDPAADQRVEPRGGVAAWDEDALAGEPPFIPLDGDAMGGVFGGDAEGLGHEARPHAAQANQADAGHAPAVNLPRPKRPGQHPGQHGRINPKVHQDASLDQAADDGKSHGCCLQFVTETTATVAVGLTERSNE